MARLLRTVLLGLVCGLSACSASMRVSTESEDAKAPQAAAETTPARDDLNALLWMQTATEWEALCRQAFRVAQDQLRVAVEHLQFVQSMRGTAPARNAAAPYLANTFEAAAARQQSWNALVESERTRDDPLEPLAVIVDVDETVLDNTSYQVRRLAAGDAFGEQTWDAWSNERRARALPGAAEFAQFAAKHGVAIFYVTNRMSHLRDATADNLRSEGFPVPDDDATVLTREDARGWTRDKGTRRSLVDDSHRVVLLLGDNLGDFIDGVSVDNAARAALVEPYRAWWGERWIMLPNPAYGSWEGAVTKFCKDPAQIGDARACKVGWLRMD